MCDAWKVKSKSPSHASSRTLIVTMIYDVPGMTARVFIVTCASFSFYRTGRIRYTVPGIIPPTKAPGTSSFVDHTMVFEALPPSFKSVQI